MPRRQRAHLWTTTTVNTYPEGYDPRDNGDLPTQLPEWPEVFETLLAIKEKVEPPKTKKRKETSKKTSVWEHLMDEVSPDYGPTLKAIQEGALTPRDLGARLLETLAIPPDSLKAETREPLAKKIGQGVVAALIEAELIQKG